MNKKPDLDLKVGDAVLVRETYGRNHERPWIKGTVTAVKRVYVTADFGVWHRNGDYRRDNGARKDGNIYLTTQERVDWEQAREDARQALQNAGLSETYRLSDGLLLAVAAFLETVDENGEPK
jgi:hypothetical protein